MKHIGLAVGATVAMLSVGCAFLGLNPIPLPTPAPTATPSPAPTATPTPAPTPTLAPGAPTPDPDIALGKALYDSKCAGCHANNAKKKYTRAALDGAISSNFGGMGSLSTLTDAERNQLVKYSAQVQ